MMTPDAWQKLHRTDQTKHKTAKDMQHDWDRCGHSTRIQRGNCRTTRQFQNAYQSTKGRDKGIDKYRR
jgi:hypothetical protein